jgi:hypothetical protein
VTVDTPLWLQAWGRTGGRKNSSVGEAVPGFAQIVTTIDDQSTAEITTPTSTSGPRAAPPGRDGRSLHPGHHDGSAGPPARRAGKRPADRRR